MKINERSVAQYSISSAPADKEGYLNKKGELNRGYQRRWFILKGNLLYYFERKFEKEPIGVVILENCHVELAMCGEPYAFQINFGGSGNRNYVLGADTPQEMEAWMKAISHANFDYMKMMVEELDGQLRRLSRTASSASSTNASLVSSTESDKRDFPSLMRSSEKEKSLANSSELLIDLRDDSPQTHLLLRSDFETRASMGRFEPSVGHLIDTEDDTNLPMGAEYCFNENDHVYSVPKPEDEFVSVASFSELKRFEELRTEDLLKLRSTEFKSHSLNLESRSSVGQLRQQRSKSERRRNNLKSTYDNGNPVVTDKGKYRTVARSANFESTGVTETQRTDFKNLHEQYGASIWVKVKEFGKQDMLK